MGIGNLSETWAVATSNWGIVLVAVVVGVVVGWLTRAHVTRTSEN
jgi:cell division protein FtsX